MAQLRLTLVVFLIVAGVTLHAQAPCIWNEQPGQIVEDCGKVGIGTLLPWGGLHVRGTGQTETNPELTATTNHGSVLFLQDTGGLPGNGGMIAFGAAQGHFAGIKGAITDGSNNTLGTLLFATRHASADTRLTERMRILRNGHVLIGTIDDVNARLHVFENSALPGGAALTTSFHGTITQNGDTSGFGQIVNATYHVVNNVNDTGSLVASHVQAINTGPGVFGQTTGLSVHSGAAAAGKVGTAYGAVINITGGNGVSNGSLKEGYGLLLQDVLAASGYGIVQRGANDQNSFAGFVGIGTADPKHQLHVVGNVKVEGTLTGTNIQAQFQDVAEWVPSREDLAPGTVVVLDPSIGNAVMKSSKSYDTSVAGVVSAQPGIILGEGGAAKEQVATTGRVRVRVDATAAPIRVGDLLVTSDKPGTAMRSQPIEIAGRSIHQPGTIIGKALEALAAGEGEILVLLSMQ